MTAKQQRTYQGISLTGFEQMRAELKAAGADLPDSPSGTTPAPHGYTIGWVYSVVSNTLLITLEGSHWFINSAWAAIEAHVKKFESAAI